MPRHFDPSTSPQGYLQMGEDWPGCVQTGQQKIDVQGGQTVAGRPCDWHVLQGWLCGSHSPAVEKESLKLASHVFQRGEQPATGKAELLKASLLQAENKRLL